MLPRILIVITNVVLYVAITRLFMQVVLLYCGAVQVLNYCVSKLARGRSSGLQTLYFLFVNAMKIGVDIILRRILATPRMVLVKYFALVHNRQFPSQSSKPVECKYNREFEISSVFGFHLQLQSNQRRQFQNSKNNNICWSVYRKDRKKGCE